MLSINPRSLIRAVLPAALTLQTTTAPPCSPVPSRPCHRSLLGAQLVGWSSPVLPPLPDARTFQGSCRRARAPSPFSLSAVSWGRDSRISAHPGPTPDLGARSPKAHSAVPLGYCAFTPDSLHHSSQCPTSSHTPSSPLAFPLYLAAIILVTELQNCHFYSSCPLLPA